jgi:ribosome-associated protein
MDEVAAHALYLRLKLAKMKQKAAASQNALVTEVVEGMRDKKGQQIVKMDLRKLNGAIADYFVICTGTSDTHVQAVADSVEDRVREHLNDRPLRREGYAQGEWVLLDYVTVIVHIFLRSKRDFFSIEELWGDAVVEKVAE